MPVQRRRLDLQPVCQRPHRQALQTLFSDQRESGADEALPRQSLLPLVVRAQFVDSPLFLLVGLVYLTSLGVLYANDVPDTARSSMNLSCKHWTPYNTASLLPRAN